MAKGKSYTVIVVPNDGSRTFKFTASQFQLRLIKYALAVLIILIVIGAASYWTVARRALQADALENRNLELEVEARKIARLTATLERIKRINRQLLTLWSERQGEELRGLSYAGSSYLSPFLNSKDAKGAKRGEWNSIRWRPTLQPVDGWIVEPFEITEVPVKREHTGVKIASASNSIVKAPADGTVTFADWKDDWGSLIEIDHNSQCYTRYGHNLNILVHKGERVIKGQAIALLSGNNGKVEPYLYYEIWEGEPEHGEPRDPQNYFLKY